MNRRHFLKSSAIVTGALSLGDTHLFARTNFSTSNIHILHTNDVHSRLEPFPMDGGKYQGMGGIVARKAAIEHIRSIEKNTFLFDSGDIFQGTPYFNKYKGEPEMRAMTKLGYDAGTMGNHDFDGGAENFALQMQHINFPIVVCNYNFSSSPLEDKVPPYTIIKRNGFKIGVIGVGIALKGLVPQSLYGTIEYENPIPIVNLLADKLRHHKKCDMIIILSHLGYDYEDKNKMSDKVLAKETRHVDLILGGHTHTFLEEPFTTKNLDNKQVIINQAGWGGIQLGHLVFKDLQEKSQEKNIQKKPFTHNGIFLK
jgi:5'-nucleotidase